MNTQFKETDGIKIFLTEDGKFTATIKGKIITKGKLSEVETLIRKTLSAIIAYSLTRYRGVVNPTKVRIMKFEKGRARTEDGRLQRSYESYYLPTPEQLDEINRMVAEQNALDKKWENLVRKIIQLTPNNIEEYRK